MKNFSLSTLIALFVLSCGEKLIEEPENLIPKDKMVLIIKDLALVNAAKLTNKNILEDNDIDPTSYIFDKYNIDSLQFVESDRYYASLPTEYEAIYVEVETLLEEKKQKYTEDKQRRDSLKLLESKQKQDSVLENIKSKIKRTQDTLQ